MSEWKKVKLGELYEVHNGLSKGRQFFGTGFPFLTFSNVFNNWFLPEQLESLVQTTDKERESCSIKAGDVFITRTSETMDELGMSSVALKDYPNATYNGFTKRLRPKTDRVFPRYMGYYLRTPKFRGQFMAFSSMTTRASLANNDLLNMEIELPPMDIQKNIATILSRYDSLIENYQKQIKLLEEAAQRLYKEWFIDLHFPGHENTNIIDGVPEGWEMKKVGEIAIISAGGDKPDVVTEEQTTECQVPIYSNGTTKEGLYGYTNKSSNTAGSITISARGSIGFACLRMHDYFSIVRLISIKPQNNVDLMYLFQFTKVHTFMSNGAAQQQLTVPMVKAIDVVYPAESLLEAFENVVLPLYKKVQSLQSQLSLLTEARDRLLPKLMGGEIEI